MILYSWAHNFHIIFIKKGELPINALTGLYVQYSTWLYRYIVSVLRTINKGEYILNMTSSLKFFSGFELQGSDISWPELINGVAASPPPQTKPKLK